MITNNSQNPGLLKAGQPQLAVNKRRVEDPGSLSIQTWLCRSNVANGATLILLAALLFSFGCAFFSSEEAALAPDRSRKPAHTIPRSKGEGAPPPFTPAPGVDYDNGAFIKLKERELNK